MIGSLRNEGRVLRRHPMIWVAMIAILLFSAAVVRGAPTDPEEGARAVLLWANILFPMFMLPFFAGALAPIFYLREVDHDMAGIVGSYPMTARKWLMVRVSGFALLILFASLLSQTVVSVLLIQQFPGEGGLLALDMLKWLIVLQLPNSLFWASLLAWVASRKAHSGLIYFSAGMIWLGYNAIATLAGSPMIAGSFVPFEPLRQAMFLLDPYAGFSLLSAVPESGLLQSRELNVAVSRLFWIGVSFLLLAGIKTVPMLAERKPDKAKDNTISIRAGWPSHLGIHLRYVVRDKVFPLLILGWIVLMLPEVIGGMTWVEPLSVVEADSRDALNRVMWDVVIGAGILILLYISDRVCRLYTGTRMQELYAATPHRPVRLVGVQLASVWLFALFFIALVGVVVLTAQVALQSPIQPAEYALQLGLAFTRLALFGGLYVALHGLIRQRFVANLAGLMIIVLAFSPLLTLMKLYHPLWRPLRTTLFAPDHYWGFGGSIAGHWPYTIFWGAIGLCLLMIAVARHHRSLPFVQKRLASTVRHPAMAIAAVALGAASLQAYSIDRTLRSEGALASPDDRYDWRAAYERDYTRWAGVAQPEVEAIKARVDFSPSAQYVRLRADLTLLNRTDEAISEILVGRNQVAVAGARLTMDDAIIAHRDEVAGQTVFALNRPLAPGERTVLKVDLSVTQSNLTTPSFPLVLRHSFNSLPAYVVLPFVGYRKEVLLRDPTNREEQGLLPIEVTAPSGLGADAAGSLAREQVMLDTIVTTEPGFQAVAQGRIVGKWEEEGRSAFHFRTEQPIRAMPAYFSVPWQPQHWAQGDVDLQLFAPDKIEADNSNVLGMKDAVAFLGSELAPYRGSTLSLLAVPDIGFTGYALPQIIQVSHKFAFRAQPTGDAGFSHLYRRAAHETAHQWFGHMIGYGVAEDRAFLIESLAKYAELVLIERRYGREAMEALVDYEYDRYREARIDPNREVLPLIDAEENFDQYSRATLAFSCLRQHVGDAPILSALRETLASSAASNRAATSNQVVQTIMDNVDASDREIVRRLLLGTEPVSALLSQLDCR